MNGRPFYVMEFVDGHIVRDADTAERELDLECPASGRVNRSPTLWPRLHAVDVDAVGLGRLRQARGVHRTPAAPLVRAVPQFGGGRRRYRLPSSVPSTTVWPPTYPPQVGTAIVHGDYRLDNTVLGPDGTVRAVLDWEICTLGDPLADLGLLMVYWTDAGDEAALLGVTPTTVPGFPSRAEIRDRYQAASGRDLGRLDFYCRLRVLEAGLHPPGCLRPLRRGCRRRGPLQCRRVRLEHRAPGRDGAEHVGGSA